MSRTIRRCVSFQLSIIMLMLVVAALWMPAFADAAQTPELKPNNPTSITLLLEDEKVSMSVAAYLVAEYKDGVYTFLPAWDDLNLTPYAKMERASQRNNAADQLKGYIWQKKIPADYTAMSQNGQVVFSGLKVGVYLIDTDDSYAGTGKLSRPVLVETPQLDEDAMEYMYDVSIAPKWDPEAWFTFRPEVVSLMTVVIVLGLSAAFCFFGFHAITAIFMGAVALASGLLGVELSKTITGEFLYYMVFFVMFAVTGAGAVLFVSMVISPVVRPLGINKLLYKHGFWITSILGGGFFAWYLMKNVWYAPIFNILIFVVMTGAGMWVQYRRKKEERPQYTYLDLLKMPLPEEVGVHD